MTSVTSSTSASLADSVEVCLSPDLLHLHQLAGKVVVAIDVLRATSTMVKALYEGVAHIRTYADLDSCRLAKAEGYLIAAERDGFQVPDFDLGNSPLAFEGTAYAGKLLALTTTNGTVTIQKSQAATQILVASFCNLTATANYLKVKGLPVVLACAGWKGQPSAEDTLFAGALAQALGANDTESDALHLSTTYAKAAAAAGSNHQFLDHCSHVTRLAKHGLADDIAFCLQYDTCPIVVGQNEQGQFIVIA